MPPSSPNIPNSIPSLSLRLLYILALIPAVTPFGFSYSAPSECGNLEITWQGGSSPFTLLITPTFDVPRTIEIPDSAFSSNKGSYSFQLPLKSQKQFLLTMSDSTGFGSGGTSDLLTVADPLNGATCDTTEPKVDFDFQLNSALQQCRPYVISNFNGARQPAYIRGLIPLGSSFVLTPAQGQTSYSWTANVKAGTRLILSMYDSQNRNGGSSDLLTIGQSDDSSCLNSASPASTANSGNSATQTSATATASSTSGDSNTGTSSGGGSNTGAIIGGIVAGIVIILVLTTLLVFFLRKRRREKDTPHVSDKFGKRHTNIDLEVDDHPHHVTPDPHSGLEPVPYVLPGSAAHSSSNGPPTAYSDSGTEYPPNRTTASWSTVDQAGLPVAQSSQGRSSKFSEAYSGRSGPSAPTRFIVHSDAGEVNNLPEEDEDEVVELPPQYSSLTGDAARRPSQRRPGGQQNIIPSAASTPTQATHQSTQSLQESYPLLSRSNDRPS